MKNKHIGYRIFLCSILIATDSFKNRKSVIDLGVKIMRREFCERDK